MIFVTDKKLIINTFHRALSEIAYLTINYVFLLEEFNNSSLLNI